MESTDFLPGEDWTPEQDDNFNDLFIRSYMMDISEQVALWWETGESQIDDMTSGDRLHHKTLEQAYIDEVGIHPSYREVLKTELDDAIKNRCRQSLAAVLLAAKDQSSNIEPCRFACSDSAV